MPLLHSTRGQTELESLATLDDAALPESRAHLQGLSYDEAVAALSPGQQPSLHKPRPPRAPGAKAALAAGDKDVQLAAKSGAPDPTKAPKG